MIKIILGGLIVFAAGWLGHGICMVWQFTRQARRNRKQSKDNNEKI